MISLGFPHGALVVYGAFLLLALARIWLNRPSARPSMGAYALGAGLTLAVVLGLALGLVDMIAQAAMGRADWIFAVELLALAPAAWLTWAALRRAFSWPLHLEAE